MAGIGVFIAPGKTLEKGIERVRLADGLGYDSIAISERFLAELGGIGSAEDVRGAVERYRDAGATSPCLGGIPGTPFEAALEAAAELI